MDRFPTLKRLINFKGARTISWAPSLLAILALALVLTSIGQQAFANEPAKSTPDSSIKGGASTQAGKKAVPSDLFMVELKGNADRDSFDSLLKELHGTLIDTKKVGPLTILVIQAEPGTATDTEKKLSGSKEVKLVQRNLTYRLNQAPNDILFSAQWDLTYMNYAAARQQNTNAYTPVMMYFLDTGFNPLYGETTPWTAQYDFSRPWQPSGHIEKAHDSGFHGTCTATVLCDTNNYWGFSGMSNFQGNRTSLIECRISQDGETANGLNIIYALAFVYEEMAQHLAPIGPVNLSFGSPPPYTLNANPLIQEMAQLLQTQGSLLVLAAGNDGQEDSSPELYARRVAAIQQDGTLAAFSDFGPFNAAAPGVDVPCYQPMTGIYVPMPVLISGTSFAAPRWCAAIADVMAVLPPAKRKANYADQIVLDTATITSQGWHVPNLVAALQLAREQH